MPVKCYSPADHSSELRQVFHPLSVRDVHLTQRKYSGVYVISLVVRGLECMYSVEHTRRVRNISTLKMTTTLSAQCI